MLADRQAASALRAGGFDVELPNFADERAAFDVWLNAEPEPVLVAADSEQMELRRALGVA